MTELEHAKKSLDQMLVAHKIIRAQLTKTEAERDALRAKLERVRRVQRWDMEPVPVRIDEADIITERADDGEYVMWDDLAAIIGKDGE